MAEQEIKGSNPNVADPSDEKEVVYIDSAYPQTHPDRLFAVASIFGMNPVPVTECRVLDLDPRDGGNLVSMAYGLPNSQFVGICTDKRELEHTQKKIDALKLTNIEIKQLDLLDVDKEIGEFDYIIAHGVYSWVPDEKRQKILKICNENLRANGVAYVSYNSLPGWRMHGLLRDMMLYHVKDTNDSQEMVKRSRHLMGLLASTSENQDHVYGLLLQNEKEMIDSWPDGYLRHDTLADVNQPYYFHEFMRDAAKEDLKYLAEADFHSMVPNKFPKEALDFIKELGTDTLAKEQYMDFFRNRMFRETLLCHEKTKISREINFDAFRRLYFAAPIQPISDIPDIQSDKVKTFKSLEGVDVASSDPILKALLLYLSRQYPQPKDFNAILENVKKILGADYQFVAKGERLINFELNLLKSIYDGFALGMMKLYAHPIKLTSEVKNKPETTALVRYEAEIGLIVTNQLHESVKIDIFTHHLLPHMDGSKTKDELIEILCDLVNKGIIYLRKGEEAISEPGQVKEILLKRVNNLLNEFAKVALLI